MTGLDFSFYNWDLISNFVLKGLYFSVMLTVVATIGGVLFGTVLALMRLSGKKWLDVPATIYVNGMRSIPLVMVILWLCCRFHFFVHAEIITRNHRSLKFQYQTVTFRLKR